MVLSPELCALVVRHMVKDAPLFGVHDFTLVHCLPTTATKMMMVNMEHADLIKSMILKERFMTNVPEEPGDAFAEAVILLIVLNAYPVNPKKWKSYNLQDKYTGDIFPTGSVLRIGLCNFDKLAAEYVQLWNCIEPLADSLAVWTLAGMVDVVKACMPHLPTRRKLTALHSLAKGVVTLPWDEIKTVPPQTRDPEAALKVLLRDTKEHAYMFAGPYYVYLREIAMEPGGCGEAAFLETAKSHNAYHPSAGSSFLYPLDVLEAWCLKSIPLNIGALLRDGRCGNYKINHPVWMLCHPQQFPLVKKHWQNIRYKLRLFAEKSSFNEDLWLQSYDQILEMVRLRIKQEMFPRAPKRLHNFYRLKKKELQIIQKQKPSLLQGTMDVSQFVPDTLTDVWDSPESEGSDSE